MRNLEFVVTKQNNLDAIRYNLGVADVYDERTADKAASLGNIVPFQYIDVDGKRSVTSYVHDEISLETMLKEVLDKKGVYAIIGGLASVFEIGAQGIPVSYIIRDTNYVFVNKGTFAVKGMLVPLKQDIVQLSEIPAFFREVLSKVRFSEMDTDNYVARLFNIINSDDFSASKLKAYVDHQLEMMGLYINRDYGLMGMGAEVATTGNRGIRVNKLGVMQQSAMRQPQMMPPQGMQPMMGQPQMMPPQGMQPMMGQPQMMPPQGVQPVMGQPQMMPPQGVQPVMGQPQMMPPQGVQPMMGQPQMMSPQGMPPVMNQQPELPEVKTQEEVKPEEPIEEKIEEKIEDIIEEKIEEKVELSETPQMPEPDKQPDLEVPQPAMATDNKLTTSELPAIQEENEKYAIEAGIIKPVAPPSPFAPNPVMPAGMPAPGMPVPNMPVPNMPAPNMPVPNSRPTISTPIMANSAMPVEDMNQGVAPILGNGQMMPAGITGQMGMKPIPHIVRKKTGEVINITKTNFTIGKSQTKTDYAVTDNPAVSRVHCIIIQRDGVNFIKDNNSTNHTYINGVELQPGKEMLLKNKTVIQLGDEEFTFLLRKGE